MTLKLGWRLAWALLTLALALYAVGVTNAYRKASRNFTQATEQTALLEANLAAAQAVPDLRDEYRSLLSKFDLLKIQHDELVAAIPDAEPILTAENEGPVVTVEIPPVAAPSPATDGAASLEPVAPSLFKFRVKNAVAVHESAAGTIAVTGQTDVLRDSGELLASWPWDASNTTVKVTSDERTDGARWLAGPAVGLVSGKPAVGAMVVGPYWRPRVWRWRFEVRPVGAIMGGTDEWAAIGGFVVGW